MSSATVAPVESEPVESERPDAPRSPKGARTRARLLDAAKAIFEENGFLDARISYFESKDEIFYEVAAALDDELSAPLSTVIRAPSPTATPEQRIREGIRRYLEHYRNEARLMGVIEQVSRYDDHVNAMRYARYKEYDDQVAESIRQLQLRGRADPTLDPNIAASALGAMTLRFAEMWLVQGYVECTAHDAVEQLTKIFVNTLQLRDEPQH